MDGADTGKGQGDVGSGPPLVCHAAFPTSPAPFPVSHPTFPMGQRSRGSSHPAQDAHRLSAGLGGAPTHPGAQRKENALSP